MDRTQAKAFREDAEEALEAVIKKHGLTLKRSNISYGDIESTLKIEVVQEGEDPDKNNFERYAYIYGLKPEDVGKEFVYGRTAYVIKGLRPKATKNTIIVKRKSDSKEFVVPHEIVKEALKQ